MSSYFIIENDGEIVGKISKIMEEFPDFSSFGISGDYSDAMNLILQQKPNLVFLNVDGLVGNGFNFVSETQQYLENLPSFIALSNAKEKAYDALKNDFVDFLLKPVSELEIRKAILKFKKKHSTILKRTICLKSYKDYHYLYTDEILFLKADNNTTDFHLINGKVVSAYKTLKTFEDVLPDNFMRIHKSYIVNMDHVMRVNYGNLKCFLNQAEKPIPFTKTYLGNVSQLIHNLSKTSVLNLN